jgi:hypothetical protein
MLERCIRRYALAGSTSVRSTDAECPGWWLKYAALYSSWCLASLAVGCAPLMSSVLPPLSVSVMLVTMVSVTSRQRKTVRCAHGRRGRAVLELLRVPTYHTHQYGPTQPLTGLCTSPISIDDLGAEVAGHVLEQPDEAGEEEDEDEQEDAFPPGDGALAEAVVCYLRLGSIV